MTTYTFTFPDPDPALAPVVGGDYNTRRRLVTCSAHYRRWCLACGPTPRPASVARPTAPAGFDACPDCGAIATVDLRGEFFRHSVPGYAPLRCAHHSAGNARTVDSLCVEVDMTDLNQVDALPGLIALMKAAREHLGLPQYLGEGGRLLRPSEGTWRMTSGEVSRRVRDLATAYLAVFRNHHKGQV